MKFIILSEDFPLYRVLFFEFGEKQLKVYKSGIVERNDLGSFEINQTKTELIIGCGKNSLKILELQQEGKKRRERERERERFKLIIILF